MVPPPVGATDVDNWCGVAPQPVRTKTKHITIDMNNNGIFLFHMVNSSHFSSRFKTHDNNTGSILFSQNDYVNLIVDLNI
jgi:hypothetical protein